MDFLIAAGVIIVIVSISWAATSIVDIARNVERIADCLAEITDRETDTESP